MPSVIITWPPMKLPPKVASESTRVVVVPLSAVPSASPTKSITDRDPPLPPRSWVRQKTFGMFSNAGTAPRMMISLRLLIGAGVPSSL